MTETIELCDRIAVQPTAVAVHEDAISAVEWHRRGPLLASCDWSGCIQITNAERWLEYEGFKFSEVLIDAGGLNGQPLVDAEFCAAAYSQPLPIPSALEEHADRLVPPGYFVGRDEAMMRAGAAKQGAAHGDNGEADGEEGGKLLSSVVSLSNAVVLDCCWDDDTLMVATASSGLYALDTASMEISPVGDCGTNVSRIARSANLTVAVSWDGDLTVIDRRVKSGEAMHMSWGGRLIDVSVDRFNVLALGSGEGKASSDRSSAGWIVRAHKRLPRDQMLHLLDLRSAGEIESREFPTELASKLRRAALYRSPVGVGALAGSINGRCCVMYFDAAERLYRFKGHRLPHVNTFRDSSHSFPINDIHFNDNMDDVVMTAGGDGHVYMWDLERKKKLYKSHAFPQPVTASQFHHNSLDVVAVAVSDDFSGNTTVSTWDDAVGSSDTRGGEATEQTEGPVALGPTAHVVMAMRHNVEIFQVNY